MVFEHLPPVRRLYRSLIYSALEMRFGTLLKGSWLQHYHQHRALKYLNESIKDPVLQGALTPDYPIGCKRILISNDYYSALCRPNVELVTSPIERATKRGLVTEDGVRRNVDAVIYGTGFESTGFLTPMTIVGREDLDLNAAWRSGAEAYLGIVVTGFPNLFLLYGPNTNLGHNSILFMIECQVRYTIQCIERLRKKGLASLELRADAMQIHNKQLQARHERFVWNACTNWYTHESGRNTNNWPGSTVEYWLRTRRPDATAFYAQPQVSSARQASGLTGPGGASRCCNHVGE